MILEVDSVNLRFAEKVVLNNVYAKFEVGKITGILGRNGSGKSSLFKIILGVLKTEFASVRIDKNYYPSIYKTGYVKYLPQSYIIPQSVNLANACFLFEADVEKCKQLFEENKISFKQSFGNLSGGQRRLAEIIIYLNTPSQFVILDEPFTHLSPLQIEEIKLLFKNYSSEKSLIISDHQYRHILDISDEVYLIKEARTYHLYPPNYLQQLKDLMYIL